MRAIGFLLNGSEFMVPINYVGETIPIPNMRKLPNIKDSIEGIANIRGKVISVVNIKKVLNMPDNHTYNRLMIITIGKFTCGILVDEISGVIDYEETNLQHSANFLTTNNTTILSILPLNDGNRLVALLDVTKIIDIDTTLLEEQEIEVKQIGNEVEITKEVQSIGGTISIKEKVDAKKYFQQKGIEQNDPRVELFELISEMIESMYNGDLQKTDEISQKINEKMNKSNNATELLQNVGKVARRLHDSLQHFRSALDPTLSTIASTDIQSATDKLNFVIEKTEEAANKTMSIVEKHILQMDDISAQLRILDQNSAEEETSAAIEKIKTWKNELENDLTDILTTQSFQDLTGQTIKKVIGLVSDIEKELIQMITTFGVKISESTAQNTSEKVEQGDVDNLLKEFGF